MDRVLCQAQYILFFSVIQAIFSKSSLVWHVIEYQCELGFCKDLLIFHFSIAVLKKGFDERLVVTVKTQDFLYQSSN